KQHRPRPLARPGPVSPRRIPRPPSASAVFVPEGFEPPLELATDLFSLEPLGPEHNERDYAAWSSSVDHIRASPGYGPDSSWPHAMSLAQNLADLERHARDFAERRGFTYAVLDPEGDV